MWFYSTLNIIVVSTVWILTAEVASGSCDVDVPSIPKSRAELVVLFFTYPLQSQKLDLALKLLEQTGNRAIFHVNTTEIDIHTEQNLRGLVRHGHTILSARCNPCDDLRMEMGLGFHLPFSSKNRSSTCNKSLFTLHLTQVSLVENDDALNWLQDNLQTRPLYRVEQMLSDQQLSCVYDHLECATTALGETRYRSCNQVVNEYRRRTGFELPPFSRFYSNSLSDVVASKEFVTKNRERVELAYRHLTKARQKMWGNEMRTLQEIMLLLYSVTDTHIEKIAAGRRIRRILRKYVCTRQFDVEVTRLLETVRGDDKASKWSSYSAAIILCAVGLLGLYASTENNRGERRFIATRFRRALSSVKASTADFAKVV